MRLYDDPMNEEGGEEWKEMSKKVREVWM